ncbi:VOC family protein [Halorarum salinum]|uniref:VOC family protein n=1 Tax=Halorarum salinum TaxID=2743089 RepID=A0A7D5QHZ1_9EURY|nr:VOC family protein [Halobaculum salinum]QLG63303.1 VOC family protein [Halobaculum salinum]
MTRTAAVPDAARIGRTALRVADLGATTAFYRDVVGLTVQSKGEATATLGAGGTPLLVLEGDEEAPLRSRDGTGLFHNAFRLPSRGALGGALDRIRDRWTLDGASDHLVSEALYLADPEGNGVEVYWDKPREEWPRADDGTVRMDTLPLDPEAVAAGSDGAPEAPPGTTVGHVHLEVSSIDATRAFYVDTLGFDVQFESGSVLFLAAGDYHHHIGANTWNGRSQPADGRGLAWFEIVLPDEAALSSLRRGLADADVAVTELDDGVEVADPDGIRVRLRAE